VAAGIQGEGQRQSVGTVLEARPSGKGQQQSDGTVLESWLLI
jgi:hypothetical protein